MKGDHPFNDVSLPMLTRNAGPFHESSGSVSLLRNLRQTGEIAGYLKNLGMPAPEFWSWIGAVVEFVIGAALILGVGTRYAALLCALFLVVATALAHRYWEYPAAQATAQYSNFLKNLAIFGGALILFATGGGRFSIDRILAKKP